MLSIKHLILSLLTGSMTACCMGAEKPDDAFRNEYVIELVANNGQSLDSQWQPSVTIRFNGDRPSIKPTVMTNENHAYLVLPPEVDKTSIDALTFTSNGKPPIEVDWQSATIETYSVPVEVGYGDGFSKECKSARRTGLDAKNETAMKWSLKRIVCQASSIFEDTAYANSCRFSCSIYYRDRDRLVLTDIIDVNN